MKKLLFIAMMCLMSAVTFANPFKFSSTVASCTAYRTVHYVDAEGNDLGSRVFWATAPTCAEATAEGKTYVDYYLTVH